MQMGEGFEVGPQTPILIMIQVPFPLSRLQGRIQDFQIEGAQKVMCTRRTSRARNAKSLTAGVQGLLKAQT